MNKPKQMDFFEKLEVVAKRHRREIPKTSQKAKRIALNFGLSTSLANRIAELNGGQPNDRFI